MIVDASFVEHLYIEKFKGSDVVESFYYKFIY